MIDLKIDGFTIKIFFKMSDWITKKPNSKFLVEDCYKLHTRDLGKGMLSPTSSKGNDKISMDKTALLLNGLNMMKVSFKVNLEANPINIKIVFSRDPKNWSKNLGISQTVDIELTSVQQKFSQNRKNL